jgi:Gas vesicle synthesis protein GvpL/GvpF
MSMSQNLHGVVRANHPLTTDRFRLITWRDLAMVVSTRAGESPHTGQHTPHQGNALAHLEMLSRLVMDGPVVPLRFGITAVDEDTVRTEVLARSATRLREHLDRLDGAVEVHAYLRFDESAALRAVFDENPAGWRTNNGLDLAARIRLGERVAHHVAAWRRAQSRVLLAPVAAVARAQVSLTEREYTEERLAFLVPTGELDIVRAAIADLSNAADLDAECVAPLPAYSFLAEPTQPQTNADHTPTSRWGW